MIITVDGPAASGKGTLARKLATHYDLAYLDTGSLYRAVALALLQSHIDPSDVRAAVAIAKALDVGNIDQVAIRKSEVDTAASIVAALEPVRAAIRDAQRQFANNPADGKRGTVLDGRDIGTVICPNADVKLYVDASAEVRAKRRFLEHQENDGTGLTEKSETQFLKELMERDRRDELRESSPLRMANDAYLLDTSDLSIEAAFEAACEIIDASKGPSVSHRNSYEQRIKK